MPPITVSKYLEIPSNRCRLILLSNTQLNENDCRENLLKYGSVKNIALSSDLHVAFVDFHCEHAPLLFARCFLYQRLNPWVPMPKELATIMPGCSYDKYLYLQVPPDLSTHTIRRYFYGWSGTEVTVYRPGIDSTNALVVLNVPATVFTDHLSSNDLWPIMVLDNYIRRTFYAIPYLSQLADDSAIISHAGCSECKVAALRPRLLFQERRMGESQVEKGSTEQCRAVNSHNSPVKSTENIFQNQRSSIEISPCQQTKVKYGETKKFSTSISKEKSFNAPHTTIVKQEMHSIPNSKPLNTPISKRKENDETRQLQRNPSCSILLTPSPSITSSINNSVSDSSEQCPKQRNGGSDESISPDPSEIKRLLTGISKNSAAVPSTWDKFWPNQPTVESVVRSCEAHDSIYDRTVTPTMSDLCSNDSNSLPHSREEDETTRLSLRDRLTLYHDGSKQTNNAIDKKTDVDTGYQEEKGLSSSPPNDSLSKLFTRRPPPFQKFKL